MEQLLGLHAPFSRPVEDATNYALRELKRLADTAIKPLEQTFKYSSVSTRMLSGGLFKTRISRNGTPPCKVEAAVSSRAGNIFLK